MEFNINFPKDLEWILNKYLQSKTPYEFECWYINEPEKTIAQFKTKTASEMSKKINQLVKKLNK